jgi:hypothetical protein
MYYLHLSLSMLILLPLITLAAPSNVVHRADNPDDQNQLEDAFRHGDDLLPCLTTGLDASGCRFKPAWVPQGCPPPDQRGWKNIACTAEAVNDTSMDPAKQWNDLKVFEAWCDILESWPSERDVQKKLCPATNTEDKLDECFSEHAAQIIKATTGSHCGLLDSENGCHARMLCRQDLGTDGKPVAGAAGYVIYNSFQSISAVGGSHPHLHPYIPVLLVFQLPKAGTTTGGRIADTPRRASGTSTMHWIPARVI